MAIVECSICNAEIDKQPRLEAATGKIWCPQCSKLVPYLWSKSVRASINDS